MKSTLLVIAVVWMHASHPVLDLESRSENVSQYE